MKNREIRRGDALRAKSEGFMGQSGGLVLPYQVIRRLASWSLLITAPAPLAGCIIMSRNVVITTDFRNDAIPNLLFGHDIVVYSFDMISCRNILYYATLSCVKGIKS